MDSLKYCAFISYRHQTPDQEIAKALHTSIENFGIPRAVRKATGRKKMGRVFRDQEELPLNTDLGKDIEEALDGSEWFIAVCSPRYLESRWCMRELEYFIEKKGREHVLTILAEGEPENSFPELLRFREDEAGNRVPVEPLAADVRAGTLSGNLKKLKNEKLRILAPMLGLSFDDLKQRARQRKIRIASAVAAAVVVFGSATASFLVINHVRQEALRREAEHNALIAEEQTKLAEENARLAEERGKIAEENARIAEEQTKLAEENARLAEERGKIAEENARVAEEQTKLAEENARLAEERGKIAEENARIAEENARIAEEQKQIAAEKERLAVTNEIRELLQRADNELGRGERSKAAGTLLEALALSESADGAYREEIISALRGDMYFNGLAKISGFDNENVRLTDMKVSPDGKHAIGVENLNSVALVDFSAGRIVYRVSTGDSQVWELNFAPDGSRFVGNYLDHITVWNTADGSEVFTYKGSTGKDDCIATACFWKDPDTILVLDREHLFRISVPSGEKTLIYTIGEHQEWYDPNDNILVTLTGNPPSAFMTQIGDFYLGVSVVPSPDWSGILVSGRVGDTGTVIIDENGALLTPLEKMPAVSTDCWAFSPDGSTVVVTSQLGFYGGWDAKDGHMKYLSTFPLRDYHTVSNPSFSPDSRWFAMVADNNLYVHETATGRGLLSAGLDQTVYVPDVSFSADSRYILVEEQHLLVIDAETYELLIRLEADEGTPYNAAFSMEDTLFTVRGDGTITVYAQPELSCVSRSDSLPAPLRERYYPGISVPGAVTPAGRHVTGEGYWKEHSAGLPEIYLQPRIQYSRDGSRTALLYPDGVIELFDTFGDGSVLRTLGQNFMPVTVFGMVGSHLVAADYSGRVMFYDMENDRVIRMLNVDTLYTGFAFNSDGSMMMALRSGGGYAIDVYRLDTADLLFTLTNTEPFTEFAFTEDDRYAVGVTVSGSPVEGIRGTPLYIFGNLYRDEADLLERARKVADLYN